MCRASEIQEEAFESLELLKQEATELKREAVKVLDEDSANAMLSIEEACIALSSEIRMYLALKKDEAARAWDHLIDAQRHMQCAITAHDIGDAYFEDYYKLYLLEQLLFPKQLFVSPGMILEKAECSICGSDYDECEHVQGLPYMGDICVRIISSIRECTEVSFVEEPADKRCRILSVSNGDKARDTLSWRFVEPDESE